MDAYRREKGSQWKARVTSSSGKGKKQNKASDVVISIGLMEWHDRDIKLKSKRGRRIALRVTPSESYSSILIKAVTKWQEFHQDLYKEDEHYILVYESGQEAFYLPGSALEQFSLQRYREEIGKDYKRVVLYLCTISDQKYHERKFTDFTDDSIETNDEVEGDTVASIQPTKNPPLKQQKRDAFEYNWDWYDLNDFVADDSLANIELPSTSTGKTTSTPETTSNKEAKSTMETSISDKNTISISDLLRELRSKVNPEGQFFLVIRRDAELPRILSLWKRESKKSDVTEILRVHFTGEAGIDSGAIGKEFLENAVTKIGQVMFPFGAPTDSMLHMANGDFRACGEIVACSLVQGGPAPQFLHKSSYELLTNDKIDLKELEIEKHITESEAGFLEKLKSDPVSHSDFIIEHGYTGIVNPEHGTDIVKTVMTSIVSRRLRYLQEFKVGLKLFGLFDCVKENKDLCKTLFIIGNKNTVDANYILSILRPSYSPEGSTRKIIEVSIIDFFQDLLFSIEDADNIAPHSEYAITIEEDEEDNCTQLFKKSELTVPGVLAWLTGQRHCPLDGSDMTISVSFDHSCMERNPNHSLCFPTVGACGKEITFPAAHMKTSLEFKDNFILAYSNGQAFGRP